LEFVDLYWLVVLNDGGYPGRAPKNVAGFFSPLVPVVLGHTTSKSEEVDQTEWWAAKQGLLSNLLSDSKVIVQKLPRREGTRRVCPQAVHLTVKARYFFNVI